MSPALGAASQLPQEVDSFVGRRREINYTKQLYQRTRLVTLTGVGGVGKTRLAIHLARQSERGFPDGVCFVPLTDLRDPSLLCHTVATALGLREYTNQQPLDRVIEHLATRRLLLILDNCEHLLAFCAEFVGALLRACPDVRVLATSREPLGIAGESTLPVQPLSAPPAQEAGSGTTMGALAQYEAVGLFLDRAASAVPGFELTEANHQAVATLVHSLDGLPLALELAAVRLRALSLEQIIDRLADRCELLDAGRGVPARQRTLGALMSWSFDLCTVDEQMLWTRLSVFSGGIELEAAEGVCADSRITRPAIVGVLVSLVDKSILLREEVDGRVRYRLLETVREFGQQKLRDSGELIEWRRRHRDWYQRLVDRTFAQWHTVGQGERLDRLRRDHANLRAALIFCLDEPREAAVGLHLATTLYFYWLMGGFLAEGRHWIELMLGACREPIPAVGQARALCVGSSLATLCGDLEVSLCMLSDASDQAPHDPAIQAYVLQSRALLALFRDELGEAVAGFEDALERFDELEDETGTAFTLFLYGLAAALSGHSDKVAAAHLRCLELTESDGEDYIRSCSMWTVGVDAWLRGDCAEGMRLQRAALLMKRPLGDYLGISECLESLAWIEATERRHERAAVLFGAADSGWRRAGMPLSTLPGLQRQHEICERIARAVGQRPFQAAYRTGARMSLEEAIAFAVGEKRPGRAAAVEVSALTRREQEVADLIARGLSNNDIAKTLVLSRRTVEAHVQHLMAKLNFTSRTQVAAWAAEKHAATA
jgi:predicted ATPase/DNA-binding NarL/FixJ family response regulator